MKLMHRLCHSLSGDQLQVKGGIFGNYPEIGAINTFSNMSLVPRRWHKRKIILSAFALGSFLCCHSLSHAADAISFELAKGNKTQAIRVGAQWDWQYQWWKTNGTHIGGYWDVSLAQWRGDQYQNVPGNKQNITDIGITPVFRLQSDNRIGFYGEAGIGAHFLNDFYNNNGRELSTHLQLGSLLGVGYVFGNSWDIGLKVQHFSNGGIKKPNSGVNFAGMRVGYRF